MRVASVISCKSLTAAFVNCAVDSYEFTALPDAISVKAVEPSTGADADKRSPATLDGAYEHKPHFHEWATALPGMLCVSRKARNSTFRNYVAAETATPVRKKSIQSKLVLPCPLLTFPISTIRSSRAARAWAPTT